MASSAAAEWPNLNPFSTTKSSSSKSSSWLPSWGTSKPAPRKAPTTWQRVQAAPGQMMNKTKETLSPLNPFKPTSTKKTSGAKPAQSASWFPGWTTQEEKGPPLTVSDWLDSPRPE
jgi:hypothetical protein